MKLKRILALGIIVVLVSFNCITNVLADEEINLVNLTQNENKDDTYYATGSIIDNGQLIDGVTALAVQPSAVVHTTVDCIGSGLVDLQTRITANTGITYVSGMMWVEGSFGIRSFALRATDNGTVPFYNDLTQFPMNPGTVITTCGSSGTVVFNRIYSYPFATIPYNFVAVVK